MAITTNQTVQFNIDSIADNQILVYDANVGAFVNETIASLVNGGGAVHGVGRNIGDTGVGIYKANDGAYLDFYKLSAGANTTLTLANNVITIDATVGSNALSVQPSVTANAVAVYDETGNGIKNAAGITLDEGVLTIAGLSNSVNIEDGSITAFSANLHNLSIGGNFNLPQTDGTDGQILKTDGNGSVTWVDNVDISGKVDSLLFNAHVVTSITETSNHAPALHNFYSLGNANHQYHQVFSTYFRGTADLSVNTLNLGSQPASNYMLRADSMDADQIRSEIANIVIPSTGGFIKTVNFSDGSVDFDSTNLTIVSGDNNLVVSADPMTDTITLSTDINVHSFGRVSAEGNVYNYIVADRQNDVLNFAAGPGISVVADSNADSILISSTYREINVISDLLDVDSIGIQDGQTLIWNASNSQFEAGTIYVPSDLSELTDTTGLIPADLTDLSDTTSLIPSDLSNLTDTTGLIPADLTDLSDTTSLIPSDLSNLTDTTGLIPSDLSNLTDTGGLIPADLSDLSDTTNVVPDDISQLTDTTNLLASDLSDLTDSTNLLPSDISNLTDTTNVIPSDISQLTDTTNILGSAGPQVSELIVGTRLGTESIPLTAGGLLNIISRTGTVAISLS